MLDSKKALYVFEELKKRADSLAPDRIREEITLLDLPDDLKSQLLEKLKLMRPIQVGPPAFWTSYPIAGFLKWAIEKIRKYKEGG